MSEAEGREEQRAYKFIFLLRRMLRWGYVYYSGVTVCVEECCNNAILQICDLSSLTFARMTM
jgi:hypothetical protein